MWDKLSMAEKAAYIRVGVQNGITSLNDIKKAYNTYADGGPKSSKVNYYNPITGQNYGDTMPEGMSIVRRFEDLTPQAQDEYMASRPTQLDDLVVYPRSGKGAKSTTMGSYYDTMNTLTEQNRKHAEEVAMQDAFQKNANSINWQPVWDTIKKPLDIVKGTYNYLSSSSKKPVAIDLANKEVKQVQNQRLASAVLGNEFVEHKNNTIRRARDYKVTKDTLLGDRNIKLSNISQFAGIENGKLKIGRLENFNDTTTIIPVRNKNIGRVTKIIKEKETYPDYNKMVDEKFPQIRSFKWIFMSPKKRKEYRNKKINYYNQLVRSKAPSPYNNERVLLKAINEKGDTITLDNTFKHKMIFGDEAGNSIFINKLSDDKIRDILNRRLSNTPLYPMILDNGRYSHYDLDGNVAGYVNPLDDRESMYIIGYKNGGKLKKTSQKTI